MRRIPATRTVLTPTVLVLAALAWAGAHFTAGEPAAPARAAAAFVLDGGGFIDHASLDDVNLLPTENPAPLAVASYGD